jgi:hypothetical protein
MSMARPFWLPLTFLEHLGPSASHRRPHLTRINHANQDTVAHAYIGKVVEKTVAEDIEKTVAQKTVPQESVVNVEPGWYPCPFKDAYSTVRKIRLIANMDVD